MSQLSSTTRVFCSLVCLVVRRATCQESKLISDLLKELISGIWSIVNVYLAQFSVLNGNHHWYSECWNWLVEHHRERVPLGLLGCTYYEWKIDRIIWGRFSVKTEMENIFIMALNEIENQLSITFNLFLFLINFLVNRSSYLSYP